MNDTERAEKLKALHGGHRGEHPEQSVEEWESQVRHGNTRLGYWEWVAASLEDA